MRLCCVAHACAFGSAHFERARAQGAPRPPRPRLTCSSACRSSARMLVNASFSTKRMAVGGRRGAGGARAVVSGWRQVACRAAHGHGSCCPACSCHCRRCMHVLHACCELPGLVTALPPRAPWKKLDLPEPFAPTMQLILGENGSVIVWSLYDLKPSMTTCARGPRSQAPVSASCPSAAAERGGARGECGAQTKRRARGAQRARREGAEAPRRCTSGPPRSPALPRACCHAACRPPPAPSAPCGLACLMYIAALAPLGPACCRWRRQAVPRPSRRPYAGAEPWAAAAVGARSRLSRGGGRSEGGSAPDQFLEMHGTLPQQSKGEPGAPDRAAAGFVPLGGSGERLTSSAQGITVCG